jgi:cell division septation protein DedD
MTETSKRRLFRGIVASLIVAHANLAAAADISRHTGADQQTTITLAGKIVPGDAQKFTGVLAAGPTDRAVSAVNLNSPGGLVSEAYRIAATVRSRMIATRVSSTALCASACFLIFAAGRPKFADPGARVGVHSARELTGVETDKSATATVAMARILQSYGVPEQIVGKMVLALPEKMAWLSTIELRSMGVQITSGALPQVAPSASWPAPTASTTLPTAVTSPTASTTQPGAGITPSAVTHVTTTKILPPQIPPPQILPTQTLPTQVTTQVTTQIIAPMKPGTSLAPAASTHGWMVELGAFPDEAGAKERLKTARDLAPSPLGTAEPFIERLTEGSGDYRVRFARLDREGAEAACRDLSHNNIACVVATSPTRPATEPALPTATYVVLLASQSSEAEARRHFRLVQAVLQSKYLSVWDRPTITRNAELGDGMVYRAQVGPFMTIDKANQFCGELQFQCSVEKI